jgi:alpha-galactosidase
VTHPGAAEHLEGVYRTLSEDGFTYYKLDFLYAGAIDGQRFADASPLDAYREGLRIVRTGVGEDAILLGCGAPLLPSIGLVDAMRVGPDVDPHFEVRDADPSQPSMRGALSVGRSRAWMHARLWANDPDCLIVRQEVEQRERWAAHVEACSGLVFSSDALGALDRRGLALTRDRLRPSTCTPVDWDPFVKPSDASPDPVHTE